MKAQTALHFIGGKYVPSESGLTADVLDPSTGEVSVKMARGGAADAIAAIKEARSRAESWGSTTGDHRAEILRRISLGLEQDRLAFAELISTEVGKPLRDSKYEVERAVQVFFMAADAIRHVKGETFPADAYPLPPGNAERFLFTLREPVGVVVAISPFNFPLNLLSHKVAPALAAGNTVVAKPSSQAPRTALRLAQVALDSGLPPGVFNVVLGGGEEVGLPLVSHPVVRLVTFTGSTEVGRRIGEKAGHGTKRTILELGGMDAEIVFSDANLDAAADAVIHGCFGYSGQVCTATKRVLVEEGVAASFLEGLVARANRLKVGPAMDESTDVGPLVDGAAVERVDAMVREAVAKGAVILAGGSSPEGMGRGSFYRPTILSHVPLDSRVLQEEPFGPVAPVLTFTSEDEAVELANSTRYGLQGSVYTANLSRAFRVARRLKVGGVHINDPTHLRWDALPFGGVRASGLGREGIDQAILEMTEVKTVSVNFGQG